MWTVTIGKVLGTDGIRPCMWFKKDDTSFSIHIPPEIDGTVNECIDILKSLRNNDKMNLYMANIYSSEFRFDHDKIERYFVYDKCCDDFRQHAFVKKAEPTTFDNEWSKAKAQWPKGTEVYGRNVDGIFKGEITEISKNPGIAVIYVVLKCEDGQLRDAHVNTLTPVGDGSEIELKWPEVVKLLTSCREIIIATTPYFICQKKSNPDTLVFDTTRYGESEYQLCKRDYYRYCFNGQRLRVTVKGELKIVLEPLFNIPMHEVLEILNGKW